MARRSRYGDVDAARGEALAAELRAQGANAAFVRCDVAKQGRGRRGAGRHAAGAIRASTRWSTTPASSRPPTSSTSAEADWDAVLNVNLKGAFLVAQAVARHMAGSGGGAIVNMSSVNGVMAIPSIASYNVSKGGVDQLTRVMALALADRGIRVNAVAPGTIATELAKNAVLGSEEAKARIMSRTPMRRLGEPGEIADVVAFLLSDASSYLTGEIVYADGGRRVLNYTV